MNPCIYYDHYLDGFCGMEERDHVRADHPYTPTFVQRGGLFGHVDVGVCGNCESLLLVTGIKTHYEWHVYLAQNFVDTRERLDTHSHPTPGSPDA